MLKSTLDDVFFIKRRVHKNVSHQKPLSLERDAFRVTSNLQAIFQHAYQYWPDSFMTYRH